MCSILRNITSHHHLSHFQFVHKLKRCNEANIYNNYCDGRPDCHYFHWIYSIFSSVLDNVKINEISFDKLLILFANDIEYELHDIDVINRSIKDTQMRMDVEELR